MDALQKRTDSLWTLPWLPHECSAKTDGVVVDIIMVATWILCQTGGLFVDVITVATWMLCKNGRSLCGRYHGCHMDALQKRKESFWTLSWLPRGCSAKTDGLFVDIIMVATWMLCENGRSLCGRYHGCHMDALQKRKESFWTLSWLPHGCFLAKNGVIKTRVCESIETLRKSGESPVKMQSRRLFQHITRSKTAKTRVLDPGRAKKMRKQK